MVFAYLLTVFALVMFAMLVAMQLLGRATAQRHRDEAATKLGAIEGAVFGLLGLLLAFTFSGAATRFNERRAMIIDEANDMGTAYLRLDLIDQPLRGVMQQEMRDYVDARLGIYRNFSNPQASLSQRSSAQDLQNKLWQNAIAATHGQPGMPALVLPPLNDMFDITTKRFAALNGHPPSIILIMLVIIALACAFLAGFAFGPDQGTHRLVIVTFAAVISLALYVVFDLEYPRYGYIRIDSADRYIQDVRDSMK